MKLRWSVIALLFSGLLCAPWFVGCGPSYQSEEESMKQIEKEEAEEAAEPDVVEGDKAASGEEAEADDEEALDEPDIE